MEECASNAIIPAMESSSSKSRLLPAVPGERLSMASRSYPRPHPPRGGASEHCHPSCHLEDCYARRRYWPSRCSRALRAAQAADSVTLLWFDRRRHRLRVKFNGNSQSRVGAARREQRLAFRPAWFGRSGDGLRAVFNLEAGFGPRTAIRCKAAALGPPGHRGPGQRLVGPPEFGRQTNLASKYFGSIDPFAISYNTANMGTVFSSANTMRLDNMVLYQPPASAASRPAWATRSALTMPCRTRSSAASRPTTTTAS